MNYTEKENKCRGCMGPCGRCEKVDWKEVLEKSLAFTYKALAWLLILAFVALIFKIVKYC
jgi:hypothetical protein